MAYMNTTVLLSDNEDELHHRPSSSGKRLQINVPNYPTDLTLLVPWHTAAPAIADMYETLQQAATAVANVLTAGVAA